MRSYRLGSPQAMRLEPPLDPPDMPEDICGYCGQPGAGKTPSPHIWPDQRQPGSEYVHAECEDDAATEAMEVLTPEERAAFLQSIPKQQL